MSDKFAKDLSFMTDADWKALDAANHERALAWEDEKRRLREEIYPEIYRETIAFAAIRFGDRVFIGRRHHEIGLRMIREGICKRPYPGGDSQGFTTNHGRFVGRVEARQIAVASGQVENPPHATELFAEDVWPRGNQKPAP